MTEAEIRLLGQCFLFGEAALPKEVMDLQPVSFKKGDTVCDGTSGGAMGIVLGGRLVAFPQSGSKAVLSQFSAGDSFGVASMFGGKCYVSHIVSAKDSRVLFLGEDLLKSLFSAYPNIAVNYITFLSSRVRLLNQKISVFASADSTSRVYSHILSHTDEGGRFNGGTNMSMLAKTLGIGRTTLYREIARLCEQKLIKKENGIYYVL